jgi:hypothetical protein
VTTWCDRSLRLTWSHAAADEARNRPARDVLVLARVDGQRSELDTDRAVVTNSLYEMRMQVVGEWERVAEEGAMLVATVGPLTEAAGNILAEAGGNG